MSEPTIGDLLDRHVRGDEEIPFSRALRGVVEFLAAGALTTGRDPRACVMGKLKEAFDSDAEWCATDGDGKIKLSSPGLFRMIFHRPGQHFDRKGALDQESVFQHVQECLDEAVRDPDAMMRRVHEMLRRSREDGRR